MKDLGEIILQKTSYAIKKLSEISGITVNSFGGFNFREFIVNFDKCGKTVKEVNRRLLDYKIFGGKDLSGDFPGLGQSALFCVTEISSAEEIDNLAHALAEICGTEICGAKASAAEKTEEGR